MESLEALWLVMRLPFSMVGFYIAVSWANSAAKNGIVETHKMLWK